MALSARATMRHLTSILALAIAAASASARSEEAAPNAGVQAVEVLQSGRQHVTRHRHEGEVAHVELADEEGEAASAQERQLSGSSLAETSSKSQSLSEGGSVVVEGGSSEATVGGAKLSVEVLESLRQAMAALKRSSHTGCDLDITKQLSHEEKQVVTQLTDMRGCFPHLADACPDLDALEQQLESDVGEEGGEGALGSVLLAPGYEHDFVVRSISSDEVFHWRSTLLKLYAETTAELQVRKMKSLIAPVCFMATVSPMQAAGSGRVSKVTSWLKNKVSKPQTWIVMRRARLGEEDLSKLDPNPEVQMFSLKGQVPFGAKAGRKIAKKVNAIRAKLNRSGVVDEVDDIGFQARFPLGLEIVRTEGCQSCLEFQQVLHGDASILQLMQATDYSILIELYEATQHVDMDGLCGAKGRFPAVFKARDPKSKKYFVASLGIVDYGSGYGFTKTKPGEYQASFQKMWNEDPRNAYFHCYHHGHEYK